MGRRRACWLLTSVLFSFFLRSLGMSSIQSLDATIRDCAFRVLAQRRTGEAYQLPLPADLSGIRASAERIRSGTLWSRGTRLGSIHIPPMTTTVPFVRRLAIVYQDLGNWSASYFHVPGYSLVAPVVTCLAYDASNISSADGVRELEVRVLGDPISITFPPTGLSSTIKCARLGPQGSVQLSDMTSANACSTTRTGHFALVVPGAPVAEGETRWRAWAIACGAGGLVLVGLVGMGIFRLARKKKLEEMERQAEEGDALATVWAGRSKMPSAAMIRTEPVIEDGTAAP